MGDPEAMPKYVGDNRRGYGRPPIVWWGVSSVAGVVLLEVIFVLGVTASCWQNLGRFLAYSRPSAANKIQRFFKLACKIYANNDKRVWKHGCTSVDKELDPFMGPL